jgi:predicted dehydrogenase
MPDPDRREFLVAAAGALAGIAIVPDLARAIPRAIEGHSTAVVGVGRQGRAIIAELQKIDGVTIAAIADTDESRRQAGERRVPGAAAYAGIEELLEKSPAVSSVFVATPTHRHREVAAAALAAGKHVWCEAPLAHTVEDARAIADAARASDRVFQPGLLARSNPVYTLARTFYKSDAFRALVSMRAVRRQKTSLRAPASGPAEEREKNWVLDPELSIGLAGEWGTHQFDVFHWYTDSLPTSISGGGAVLAWPDGRTLADTIDLALRFPGGAALHYEATLGNSYEGRRELFAGTNSAIQLAWSHGWMFKEADAATQGWEVYANRQRFHNDEGITLIAGATKLAEQGKLQQGVGLPHDSLHYALVDFLASIAEGKPPVTSVEDGLRATVVGILADRAVRGGTTVAVDPELWKGGGG